ncbi:MAG TPA: amidohydrolase [Methylomirabilota bacterium]|nr:amidohydrolase [Methylomirabilota bacterium]
MLLTNARIYTLDAADRVVDTLVVRDGRIAFAGRHGDINAGVGEETLDLGGRAVLPGLVDAHGHLMHLARARLSFDCRGLGSEEEIARRVGERAAGRPRGEWITGRNWDQNLWPGRRFPGKATLDRVAPDHPVALVRIDGHATWANSAALAAGGIERATADPPGGVIARDADGTPNGLLIDTAQRLLQAVEPRPSDAQFDRAVRECIGDCLAVGLTGIHEMGAELYALASYRRLLERGDFPFRNYVAVAGRSASTWDHYRQRGPETMGDGRIVVGALKLLADGALGSRGAALHDAYCDDPGNSGLVLVPGDEVERLTLEGTARGFQLCVHAIGDRANTLVLDAFERALARTPRPDHRLRVEHAQILTDRDVPRFARLGVVPSMQATHCTSDMAWAGERLGPERLRGAYAWRSLLATGVRIAGGSDFPVESPNPFHGIHASVTRRPRSGEDPGWQPEQRMTRAEAVRSFTTWNAFASRQEATLGSLETGKAADLVVLSDDVFACPGERIAEIRPVLTIVGGNIVYRG